MKLIKKKTRTYKGKTYYKYMITIPSKLIKELEWTEHTQLNCELDDKKILKIQHDENHKSRSQNPKNH